MTVFIIVINGFVFAQELLGGEAFVLRWAAVPANIVGGQLQRKIWRHFQNKRDRQFWPRLLRAFGRRRGTTTPGRRLQVHEVAKLVSQ